MIRAEFFLNEDVLTGFSVKGHAGFADSGFDLVCASVTSAVELTANAVTEILSVDASVAVLENQVRLFLPEGTHSIAVSQAHCTAICQAHCTAICFLQALRLHLELLSHDYPECVEVIDVDL